MLKAFFAALGGAVVGAVSVLLWEKASLRLSPLDMSYPDLAATVLSATAILLAALGLLIGGAALLGWAQFRGLTKKAASDGARDHINGRLNGGDLQSHFEEITKDFLTSQLNSRDFRKLIEERIDRLAFSPKDRDLNGEGDENDA